jgi:uncharacterized protein
VADGSVASAPAPTIDDDNAFFWDGLRNHEVRLQRCTACGRLRFPPLPTCPHCATPGGVVERVEAHGTVYSWIIVHRAFDEAFAADVPYTIAVIELEDGTRLIGRLEDADSADGTEVQPRFADHDGWTELRFGPVP